MTHIRAALAATALLAAALPVTGAAETASAEPDVGSRFTLAVLPDTQFYSRYAFDQFEPRYGTNPFAVQTEWLADVRDELNIGFVTHLGDVVDRVSVEDEWVAADAAMTTLEDADLPYTILPGNHDLLNSNDQLTDRDYDLDDEPYLQWFPGDRALAQSTEGGTDETGLNQFQIFEAEGQRFLVFGLTWRASEETLHWARDVMAAHAELPTILTTHSLLAIDSDGVSPVDTAYGEYLWEELIAPNDQIFLTLNGHFHGSTYQTRQNNDGRDVLQVLMDHQMAYDGGNGYLGLFEFDLTHDRIEVQTASPWVTFKPQETLTSYDQPLLDGPTERYTVEFDFEERFAGFAPDFTAGDGQLTSLSERTRELLLDGFEGPDPVTTERPGASGDFVSADGTLAHWRPGQAETDAGEQLAEEASVPDVAGDDDLQRAPLSDAGSPTAEVGDVTIDADTHAFSADDASVCFDGSSHERFSYLSTATDAAVNDADLSGGYTVETFVRIAPDWAADVNGWSKAVVRTGNRSTLPGMPETRWDYTASPAALGISNLKEFQWTEVPEQTTLGDRTAWSGEIMPNRWLHVAVVNDPEDRATTMYVDGAPVLRNTVDTGGMSFNEGMPWIIGADWTDDAATNGWLGCVGETRIIDRPTGQDEWLTARPDLDAGFALRGGSDQQVTETDDLPELSGTGAPGADVVVGGDLAGEAEVEDDGSWTVELSAASGTSTAPASGLPDDRAAAAGRYDFTVTQGFGERRSDALTGSVEVIETPGGEDGDGDTGDDTGGDADGDAGGDGDADGGTDAGYESGSEDGTDDGTDGGQESGQDENGDAGGATGSDEGTDEGTDGDARGDADAGTDDGTDGDRLPDTGAAGWLVAAVIAAALLTGGAGALTARRRADA